MEKKYDEGLLKALGYTDDMILKMKKWDAVVADYFENEPDYVDKMYFQVDDKKGKIAFRDTTSKRIQEDLIELFIKIYPDEKR